MKFYINGNKYLFEIFSEEGRQNVCFYIRAICKSTRRTSCINNLNEILSGLNVSVENPKFVDSMWVVSEDEAKRYIKIAQRIFSNYTFRTYLEKRLDEDRAESEWENI